MVDVREVKIGRILNPTSIDLGEFVINPYKGCEYGCLYCYVRSNRTTIKEARAWGTYVDVRCNAEERLKKEIASKKPGSVLIGSTTEAFQPVEHKTGLTGRLLEILNANKINYCILTRSPYIVEYIEHLKKGCCKKIYFTINDFDSALKAKLEPKSPAFELRFKAIERLLEHHIPVVPYFSPVLPWISGFKNVFSEFKAVKTIEFEGLNFRLNNIAQIIEAIGQVYPDIKIKYEKMLTDAYYYGKVWKETQSSIAASADEAAMKYDIYIHKFGDFFSNTYSSQ